MSLAWHHCHHHHHWQQQHHIHRRATVTTTTTTTPPVTATRKGPCRAADSDEVEWTETGPDRDGCTVLARGTSPALISQGSSCDFRSCLLARESLSLSKQSRCQGRVWPVRPWQACLVTRFFLPSIEHPSFC